ncbi:MAG TPA: peptide ABC transporter substrate-binding protein, partial [Gammaproteobacteria bacterium]|nr:peptide ABC transporter substrate-binding protein [Gammaproteobacteria bacterium]
MRAPDLLFNRSIPFVKWMLFIVTVLATVACSDQPWNSPYPPDQAGQNILYSSFASRPNHLDPARSYASNEVVFNGQIYEPPLQYHFLKRPYQLEPLTATRMPEAYYLDEAGQRLPDGAGEEEIAYSVYDIEIQKGIRYQPHPAFAKDKRGRYLYHALREQDLDSVTTLSDFHETGSRELVAADYVYQIKRLAHPRLNSPIFGLMSEYIVGLKDYAATLKQVLEEEGTEASQPRYLNLADYPLAGAEVLDRYRYRIRVRGKYPQFRYWLAMPFFAPLPWEADLFYSQPGMKERNITLDWYPVGTGPY